MLWSTTRRVLCICFVVSSAGCVDDACTEIACEDSSVVSLPVGLVDGPYDLEVVAGDVTHRARCLQPASPEATENSPDLDCDASSFELGSPAGTSTREIVVTITDVDTQTVLAQGAPVMLDAVGEQTPNGPDCPPVCFVRNGALAVAGG
jgi:hypothetical protein